MKQAQALGIISITIVLTYISALTSIYGFSDDYRHLFRAVTDDQYFPDNIIVQGRPLYGFILDVVFSAIKTIEMLFLVRASSIVAIILCAVMLYKNIYNTTSNHIQSICLALLIVLTPAFGVYASWASAFHAPIAAMIAMASAYVIIQNRSTCCWYISAILLLMSLQLYQPAAMMYWLYIAIAVWGAGKIEKEKQKTVIRSCIIFMASVVSFYLIHKLTVIYYLKQDDFFQQAASRSDLVMNPLAKIKWFLKEPLFASLNIMYVPENVVRVMVIICMLTAGFIMHEKRTKESNIIKRMMYWLVACALLLISFLPNLVIKSDIEVYRTLPALYGMVIWFGYIALKEFLLKQPRVQNIVAILCVLLACVVTHHQVDEYIIQPSVKEYNVLKMAINQQSEFKKNIKAIYVTEPQNQHLIIGGNYEYGEIASISQPWVTQGMVWLVARETLPNKTKGELKVTVNGDMKVQYIKDAIIMNIAEIYGSI